MAVKTSNRFGEIKISDESIATVAAKVALDCYGVVSLINKNMSGNLNEMFKQNFSKGVKVITIDNRIQLDLFVVLKYGVSLSAVCESLKNSVKYHVENFTGMIVDAVNVNVLGIRV